eukprot:s1041_g5.t1
MPVDALQVFCDMFLSAEQTGDWPVQVVSGRVSSIAKTDVPQSALDFRPITVLGLLYRCWSSHHAQKALHHLDSMLPPGLVGSRPNRYAGQIWSTLLWEIEQAYANDSDLGGVIADIQKAFNYVPRTAVMEICHHVGLPGRLLLGWTGALVTMQRRFQVRDHLTEPLLSTTGVPEGCALSCLAMMVLDWSLHAWFDQMLPLSRPLTFVDDWQIVTTDSAQISEIMTRLFQFADMVDMLIDHKKTFSWSISTHGRAQLRTQGFAVVSRGRNLGAHVQFSRQHTNSVQIERIQKLHTLWPKLRLSASPYKQKLRAIKMAAWPRGLHAIAATSVSTQWFQTLRAGALKGLQADGAGVNSHLHLGLVECPLHDPQFWTIFNTMRFVRECASAGTLELVLAEVVSGFTNIPDNSITSTLVMRLQLLGWHITASGTLCDTLGQFSLFDVSCQELLMRASISWKQVVASEVSHRKGLESCHRVHVEHTRQWLKMLSASDAALVRKILNGAHFTQDVLCFSQPETTSTCLYCECTDSRFHRFWQCPFFDEQRKTFPASMWKLLPQLPEVLTAFGWSLQPSTQHDWLRVLADLTVPDRSPFVPPTCDTLHLFTDGSCLNQHDHDTRLAAWAVISADPAATTCHNCQVVEAGPLPGLLQSAYRAEAFAVLRALLACQGVPCKLCLWVDCAAVVKRMKKILLGRCPKPNSPHADLWIDIFHLASAYPAGCLGIFKVDAHRTVDDSMTSVEAWCARHNAFADRTAVRANFSRPPEFWSFYKMHIAACNHVRTISRHVQQVQLEVSRAQMKASETFTPVPEPYQFPAPAPWAVLPALTVLPASAARWYGEVLVRQLVSWFWQGIDPHETVRWVSHYQLYIDFQMATGERGPVHLKQWTNGSDLPLLGLLDVPFKKRTRWFIKVMKEILRHMQIHVEVSFGKPCSEIIAMHTGIWAVPWPARRLEIIDLWLGARLQSAVTRGGKSLDALPLASRNVEIDEVFFTTASF